MILLDTDVLIDILRRHPPAVAWLTARPADPIGVPGLVAMEILQGCRNATEQRRVEAALQPFALYWPERSDCERALSDFAAHRLSHNLGLLDALIAATAVGLNAPLATFNSKHYTVLTALTTLQPYAR